jgi:hypothetical protein
MRTIAVPSVSSGSAWTLLRPAVAAAEATPPGLPNREIREAPLFLVSLDTGELRPNQRPMHRALFDFHHIGLGRSCGDRLRDGLRRGLVVRLPRGGSGGDGNRVEMRGRIRC